jgi:hypothetical protein
VPHTSAEGNTVTQRRTCVTSTSTSWTSWPHASGLTTQTPTEASTPSLPQRQMGFWLGCLVIFLIQAIAQGLTLRVEGMPTSSGLEPEPEPPQFPEVRPLCLRLHVPALGQLHGTMRPAPQCRHGQHFWSEARATLHRLHACVASGSLLSGSRSLAAFPGTRRSTPSSTNSRCRTSG